MALRKIRVVEDTILRMKSKKVDEISNKIKILIDDMFETMYRNDGAGLAAPQVGILKRVVVIDVDDNPIEMINPRIISVEGEQVGTEGCLSIPKVFGEVVRPASVIAEAMNRNGERITVEADGILARAICHETDHLEGVLFTDKATRLLKPEELKKRKNNQGA